MSIIRIKKEREYVAISNAILQDKSLTWEARGVMAYLLSKPDGWECRNYDLVNQGPASEHIIRRVLKELQEAGYIHRFRKSQGRGKIEWITEIYETPQLNTAFRNGTFSSVESYETESYDLEKPVDIVSTDSEQVLKTEKTDLNGSTKIPQSEKNELNKLVPFFVNQCDDQLTRDELKRYIRIGHRMAKGICPLNIAGASDKSLKDLARAAQVVENYGDTDQTLKSFSEWWYNEYWAGKKGQPPTPAQVGDTWGQFEAQRQNVPTIQPDSNGGFYI